MKRAEPILVSRAWRSHHYRAGARTVRAT